jgi:hypothetical protein
MNVKTANSIYQILAFGKTIQIKKISGEVSGELIRVGDSFIGDDMQLIIGRHLTLRYRGKEVFCTSQVIEAEG